MLVKDPTTGLMRIDKRPMHVRDIDTGKVKIGCAYIPKPMPMSYESMRIQAALLGVRTKFIETYPGIISYAMLLAVAVSLIAAACR